jgi:hypothetical protein
MRTRHSLIAVAALSVLTLAGCDKEAVSGAPGAATPGPGQPATNGGDAKEDTAADPKTLLSNAARTSKDSGTYKFEYRLDTGDEGARTGGFAAKGEVDVRNARFKGTTTLDAGGGNVLAVDVVGIGRDFYMRSATAGDKWSRMDLDEMAKGTPGAAAQVERSGKDPLGYLDKLKEYASSTPDGTDTVRGQAATRYRVVVDRDKVLAQAEETGDGGGQVDPVALMAAQGDAKVWLDSKGRVVRFTFSGAAADGTTGGFNAELYDYDLPVSIEAPAASEVGGN